MNKSGIRTIEQLEQFTSISKDEKHKLKKIISDHPMLVSSYYLSLINWNDPDDPIRRIVVPSAKENLPQGSYDTSGERVNTKLRGLQHKYPQTALILATNQCASYCRHCFRKRLAGVVTDEIVTDWDLVVSYLKEHTGITNVLLSGGDPLTLPLKKIADILQRLSEIEHLKFIRIGTRVPVFDPDRIKNDSALLDLFETYSRDTKQLFIITQFNHPREITSRSIAAINKLLDAHIIIRNQTVLLKGVNDIPEVMAELQSRLNSIGVLPYYVFQCRPVKKVKHIFQVPLLKASAIMDETRALLDGPSKSFRFIMSHKTGKIEILGQLEDTMYFRYHQTKDKKRAGRMFVKKLSETDTWLDL